MSIRLIFAVRDEAVAAFMPPFTARTVAEAVRGFTDAVQDPKSDFGRHSKDYALYEIGEFDDESGVIVGISPLSMIVKASECLVVSE